MTKTAKIYELRDPRDGAARYVGRCTCSLASRRSTHENEARTGYGSAGGRVNAPKQDWLNELASLGLRPEIVLVKEVSTSRRFAERAWIRKRLRDGAELFNIIGVPCTIEKSKTIRIERTFLDKLLRTHDEGGDLAPYVDRLRNILCSGLMHRRKLRRRLP